MQLYICNCFVQELVVLLLRYMAFPVTGMNAVTDVTFAFGGIFSLSADDVGNSI